MKKIIIKQYQALIESINYQNSLLSNTSAFLNEVLDDVSWVGFYLFKDHHLVLDAFQGKVACNEIALDQGVCGKCATSLKSIIVSDVHKFKGHIACDSATNSELVIPIIINNELFGVLDLDSTSFDRFKENDQNLLEAIVECLTCKLKDSN